MIQALVAAVAASVAIGQNGVAVAVGASIALNLIGYDLFGDPDITVEDAEDASGFLIGTPNAAQVRARIVDTTIWSSGLLLLTATAAQTIDSFVAAGAVGVAGGDNGIGISVAGAFAGNRIRTTVEASVSDPTTGAQRDSLTVESATVERRPPPASGRSPVRRRSPEGWGHEGLAMSIGLSIAWNQVGDTVVEPSTTWSSPPPGRCPCSPAPPVVLSSTSRASPPTSSTTCRAARTTTCAPSSSSASRPSGLIPSGGSPALSSITTSTGIWTLTFTTSSGARSFKVRSQVGQLFITFADATLFDATTLTGPVTAAALDSRAGGTANAAVDAAVIARLVTAKLLTQDANTPAPTASPGSPS